MSQLPNLVTEGLQRRGFSPKIKSNPIDAVYRQHGFLPQQEPLAQFPSNSELSYLDEIGRALPELLTDPHFRQFTRELAVPPWPTKRLSARDIPALRLYYLRLGFIASAYINQVGQAPVKILPRNIAVPLCAACRLLRRPPILSYDGYALYNWKRCDANGPIALGNIETIQNFVPLYDEHWFILVHIEIEAIAAQILDAIALVAEASLNKDQRLVNQALETIATAIHYQIRVLWRIPEQMDSKLYFKTFRPYIRFFEHVIYQGVEQTPIDFRGETGAQSSIMPTLVAFMKIPHRSSLLTKHLADMRNYMPAEHRDLIKRVEALPDIRPIADRDSFNAVLEAIAQFREVHHGWAEEYINKRTVDPRGTGGTPYMRWLDQLIDETRAHRL